MTQFYHVEITPKEHQPPHRRVEHETDLSAEQLKSRFVAPYSMAETMVIRGRSISIEDLHRIRVYQTAHALGEIESLPKDMMLNVTTEFISGPPGWALTDKSLKEETPSVPDPRAVFVVHGRNHKARDALCELLRAVDLRPIEWPEAVHATGEASPYIGDILDAAFADAQAVVVLFTPDDDVRLTRQLWGMNEDPVETKFTGQARPNVLFEAGRAMERDARRTVLVELGTLRPFSDVAGRHMIRLNDSSELRQQLVNRLERAGCPAKLQGTDWHSAGDFEGALASLLQNSQDSDAEKSPSYGNTVPISGDAANLLIEAGNSRLNIIQRSHSPVGTVIRTNGKSFGGPEDQRSGTTWDAALKELVESGLVNEDDTPESEFFAVSSDGLALIDSFEFNHYLLREESIHEAPESTS